MPALKAKFAAAGLFPVWFGLLAIGLCGCESVGKGSSQILTKTASEPAAPAPSKRTLDSERTRYQTDRASSAARWLLAHCVKPHMRVKEINEVFGEDGVRVRDDTWLKRGNGYRQDDVVYRWGPDNHGRNIYLFFRDGRLINFDPKEFE